MFIYRISQIFSIDKHLKVQMSHHPSRLLIGPDWRGCPSIDEKFAQCNAPIARLPNSRPSIALLGRLETFRIGSCASRLGTYSANFVGDSRVSDAFFFRQVVASPSFGAILKKSLYFSKIGGR